MRREKTSTTNTMEILKRVINISYCSSIENLFQFFILFTKTDSSDDFNTFFGNHSTVNNTEQIDDAL